MVSKIHVILASLACLAGLLTWLPVQAGFDFASETSVIFTGFDFGEDSQAYAAYIRSGVDQNPFFLKNNSTSEPQDARYVVLYFTLISLFAKVTGAGIDVAWHLFRFLVIFFLAWTVWKFSGELFSEVKSRIIFFILFLFGGGFGWTVSVFGGFFPFLARLYSTDLIYYLGYTVFSFMFHPLAMIALSFILWEIVFLAKWTSDYRPVHMGMAVVFVLLAFFNHPAAGVVGGVLAGVIFVWNAVILSWGRWHRVLEWGIGSGKFLALGFLVIAIYTLWARGDAVYLFHQMIYLTWEKREPFWMYPFALGLPFFFGVYAIVKRQFFEGNIFFILKIFLGVSLFFSIFLPAGVKYLYLVFPALVGFSVIGLATLVNYLSERFAFSRTVLAGVFVLVMCASVPFVVEKRVSDVLEGEQYYLTFGENDAINWLNTQSRGVVLSSPEVGRVFSWNTSQQPFLAHGFLTIDYQQKKELLRIFLDNSVFPKEKQEILSSNAIMYVFYGPRERALGLIDSELAMEAVYSNDDVVIFSVNES